MHVPVCTYYCHWQSECLGEIIDESFLDFRRPKALADVLQLVCLIGICRRTSGYKFTLEDPKLFAAQAQGGEKRFLHLVDVAHGHRRKEDLRGGQMQASTAISVTELSE